MAKKSGKRGPDPIEIPREQALALAQAGWKNTWIAAHFNVHVDTLTQRITPEDLQNARLMGTGRLLLKGHQMAMEGSKEMLKYMMDRRLGKAKQIIEMNPDQERPANMNVTVPPGLVAQAVKELEEEY
jgi:hypothetical protein